MPIFQQGALNTTALTVPDLYVDIVPPQNLVINGVPTNVIGVVGTASWGPVNKPVVIGTMADYARAFGGVVARKYDMGTSVACAVQQGAARFICVRVTDGTDTAATVDLNFANGVYAVSLTALYSGSLGNNLGVSLGAGSQAGTWRLVVSMPGLLPEVYDNILAPTPASFWANLVAAVNTGVGPLRGPSQLVTAVLGSAITATPVSFTNLALLGGTDGATSISAATLVGQSGLTNTGMYALSGQGCSIAVLADSDDATQWQTQAGFALSQGIYIILVGPAGDTVSDAVAVMQSSGVDSYAAKMMFGDWVYWYDQTNATIRVVSPQGFVAGRLGNLSPAQSGLNKPLYNVIGTQMSGLPGGNQATTYSDAELSALFAAGIDVICRPQPGGNYWGIRSGHNTSSNPATNNDSYTRMTNFIAATLLSAMGQFVGQAITTGLFQQIRATQLSYLQTLLNQGILGSTNGALPFSVICDGTNNPVSRTSLGYVQSDAQVQYLGINEYFIVNVEGGQTVQVQTQILPG
jgi:phage tail sheath protein FI